MEAADVRDRHTFLPYRKLRRQTHVFTSLQSKSRKSAKHSFMRRAAFRSKLIVSDVEKGGKQWSRSVNLSLKIPGTSIF